MIPSLEIEFDDQVSWTWIPTADVLSFSCQAGRTNALDTYGAATGEIVIRRTLGNQTDLENVVPGVKVSIYDPTRFNNLIILFVCDVAFTYGLTRETDICTITLEGALAQANRAYLNNYNLAAGPVTTLLADVETAAGVAFPTDFGVSTDPQTDGTVITSVADWLQQLATTVNARLDDSQLYTQVLDKYQAYSWIDPATTDELVFTDGTLALGINRIGLSYDGIEFSSLADNYYTRVIIDPENHAAQVRTLAGATAPYRVLQLDTFNSSTSQARDYGDFLLSTYSDPYHNRLASLTMSGQSENGEVVFDNLGGVAIARTVEVIFRQTRYNAVIEGWSATVDPATSRFTFYFSGADLNNYLILDDTDRGVLNENRLGY